MMELPVEKLDAGPDRRLDDKRLERRLTPFSVWALAFGCTIGWAAFVMPGTVFLRRAGPMGSMIAIQIGLFVMLILSYSYHYMLRKFPVSGGEYVYARMAFGRGMGFLCAWFLGLCYLCVIPLNATALGLMGRVLLRERLQFGFHYTIAGYDVYMGELLLALVPVVLFALAGALDVNIVGNIQTVLAVLLLGGVVLMVVSVVFHPRSLTGNLYPMFQTDESIPLQIIAVAVTAPQLFVGFDTTPQFAEETRFSLDDAKVLMDTCIMCSAFVYIALVFLAASVPVGYLDWRGYIYDLPNKAGIVSVPTLYAAYHLMGDAGIWVWTIAATSAMLTGIIGFYVATSRLMYSLARDGMLPAWFARLNRRNTPFHATLFCMAAAVLAPFMGRTVLNWAFDMASFGGALSFACTCLAARKYALQDGRRDIAVFGLLGFLLSAALAFVLLVPIPALGCSIGLESYICLVLWSALGAAFFLSRRDRAGEVVAS
ncbi:MAG: APC family permease [Fretibacterium sp.]|nr:APC family permease [Fretibacterium sp.]